MDNLSIYITSIREGKDYLLGEWVKLPVPPEKLDEVLKRIGNEYEEYLVTDYEAAFANLNISQYSSIAELNDLATRLDEVDEWDNDKLCAVLEMEEPTSIADIVDIIEHLDDFDLLCLWLSVLQSAQQRYQEEPSAVGAGHRRFLRPEDDR